MTTALELVLPRMDAAGVYANALILRGHCVESARRTVLEDSNGYADQPARHAIAGAMLRHGDGRPEFGFATATADRSSRSACSAIWNGYLTACRCNGYARRRCPWRTCWPEWT